jgi:hypothetical protein
VTVSPDPSVRTWLLDADPSIRWRVLEDLLDAPARDVEAERARVATEGWGARLLALQAIDGTWGGAAWAPRSWASTMETLSLLRELGIDASAPACRVAIERVRERVRWGDEHGALPFFDGETEPCINGRVLACGAHFGVRSDRLVERLLAEQLGDGGWNCSAPPSVRGSFNSTLCVLEGLHAFERAFDDAPGAADARAARLRGEDFLRDRHLGRSRATGAWIERDRKSGGDWRDFAFPTRWRYDILWGLDYLRRSGARFDERERDALDLVRSKRRPDGRWTLDAVHAGATHFELEGAAGTPSRWVTVRALQALAWKSRDGRTRTAGAA